MSVRVLQAMAGAAHGGAEAFFVRLAVALERADVVQRVVIRSNTERAAALRTGGIDPIELPFGGWFDFRTRRGMTREIAAFRPDVVLTWMNRASRVCPPGNFVHVGRLGGYYDLKYYRNCDHLIGNTKDIVRYLVDSGWPAARAHYVPNFVDDRAAQAVPRNSLDTPGDGPLLLALGRLHANKAFDVLIDAVADADQCLLWLAGEGPLRAELEDRVKSLGIGDRVRFLGWRDDVPALLAAADILVCPSRHEPLGNVVIEGWAHRVPVVAAASQGPRELIRPDETGLLVPVDDAGALAAALRRLVADADLRRTLAAGGRAAFESEFTATAVVSRYLDFFERVAA